MRAVTYTTIIDDRAEGLMTKKKKKKNEVFGNARIVKQITHSHPVIKCQLVQYRKKEKNKFTKKTW